MTTMPRRQGNVGLSRPNLPALYPIVGSDTGLPDGIFFQTKNPNLDKFCRVLQWKMLVYLWSFGIFYSHMVYFMAIWYICGLFGIFFTVLVCSGKKSLATLVGQTLVMDTIALASQFKN
jgi:hypothetical protein